VAPNCIGKRKNDASLATVNYLKLFLFNGRCCYGFFKEFRGDSTIHKIDDDLITRQKYLLDILVSDLLFVFLSYLFIIIGSRN
jgi:hypothetical protein